MITDLVNKFSRIAIVFLMITGSVIVSMPQPVLAISAADRRAVNVGSEFYDPNFTTPTSTVFSNDCISPVIPRVNDPAAFAAAINQYIAKHQPNSPFSGLGQQFVDAGLKYGVNPAFLVNIARKESNLGTAPASISKSNALAHNAFGRTASPGQPSRFYGDRNWYYYDSFAASIDPETQYIKERYLDKGLNTIDAILPVFAPPSENQTSAYIATLKQWIGEIVTLADGSISCSENGNPPGATAQ